MVQSPSLPGAVFHARVLIVEDSAVQAEKVRTFLESEGYDTRLAADGRAALAAIRAARPDLILADVNMPVMGGFELCRFVKNHPAFRTIPVILLTTLADPRDLLEGLAAGAEAYLFKPFRNGELLERLAAHRHGPPPSNAGGPTTDFTFRGRDYRIEGGTRVLDFLISVYESARRQNEELIETRQHLLDAQARLEQAGARLMESERRAALGKVASGIAHRVNNPIGYVKSNLQTLDHYLHGLLRLVDAGADGHAAAARAALDFDFLREDAPRLIAESLEGIQQVVTMVEALRQFTKLDAWDEWRPEDLHAGLDATLMLIAHQLDGRCVVHREYGPLPPVECSLSRLNHLFMGVLLRLADIAPAPHTLVIRTAVEGPQVMIEMRAPERVVNPPELPRLLEGLGSTGDAAAVPGLSLARHTMEAHHGAIRIESNAEQGTSVCLFLPVTQPELRP